MRDLHRPGRRPGRLIVAAAALLAVGCAHRQLSVSTVLTANSFQTIVFQMVLNNLAMMAAEPDTLPWHVRVRDGTVQVSDTLGIGQQGGGFTSFEGGGLGIETYGPQGSRKVALQWGTDAVGDPVQLFSLQTAYRRALGLPPLPEPNYITEAKRSRAGRSADGDGRTPGDNDPETRANLRSMDIALEGEVPVGWYRIGSKKDVPKDACHVGRYGDCYVWVMPEGVGGLTRFTLLILSIVKLDSPEGGGGSEGGLMFTP
jgi:hypothetical protein